MNFPNLNDSASYASIAAAVVAIIGGLFGAYKFFSKNNRQRQLMRTNSNQQTANLNTIPEALARPSFSARQSGMQNGGLPHRTIYTFVVCNNGGNSFNVIIKVHEKIVKKLAFLRRGREQGFDVDLTSRPNHVELIIDCNDENGKAYSQRILGTEFEGGYRFTD